MSTQLSLRPIRLMPCSHRRRDETVEFRRVDSVKWMRNNSGLSPTENFENEHVQNIEDSLSIRS